LVLAIGAWLGFWLAMRSLISSFRHGGLALFVAGAAWILLALGLDAIDRTQFRTLNYAYLHRGLAFLTWMCLWIAFGCWLSRRRRSDPIVLAGMAALFAASVVTVVTTSPEGQVRLILEQHFVRSHRLVELSDHFVHVGRVESDAILPMADAIAHHRAAARRSADSVRRTEAPKRRPNLLWVTIDTLRADRLSAYGHSQNTSPVMDALAEEGVLFEQAWAQNALTAFSFQSMFYGRYPSRTPLYRIIKQLPSTSQSSTLAAHLTQAGYVTCAVPAIPASALNLPQYQVLKEGFVQVNPGRNGNLDLRAPAQNESAFTFLRGVGDQPFFLWVHYMEPHAPYEYHPELGFGTARRDRYDGEIRIADQALGGLQVEMQRLGLWNQTIVVVNSDHGEALGDHGSDFHGSTLYEEQIRIPLVVRVPGLKPRRIRMPVENVDLYPTICDLLGLPLSSELDGESLLGLMSGREPDEVTDSEGRLPIAVAELPGVTNELSPSAANKIAVRFGAWKAIIDGRSGRLQLHNLEVDPAELTDIAAQHPEMAARLRGIVAGLLTESDSTVGVAREAPLIDWALRWEQAEALHEELAIIHAATANAEKDLEPLLRVIEAEQGVHGPHAAVVSRECWRLGAEDACRVIREALADSTPFAVKGGALLSLARLEHGDRVPLIRSLREKLAELTFAPPLIARLAARLLTWIEDDTGRSLLLPGLKSPDRERRFRDAAALARLKHDPATDLLIAEIYQRRFSPELVAEGLASLALIRESRALPEVLRLVRETYISHVIKREGLRFLEACASEVALPGYLYLLSGWDPAMVDDVRRSYVRVYGARSLADAERGARDLADGMEQLRQGLAADARAPLERVAQMVEGGSALDLLHARACRDARDLFATQRVCAQILSNDQLALWHSAARHIRAFEKRPVLLQLDRLQPPLRPLVAGADLVFDFRLRNVGEIHAMGGQGPDALSAHLIVRDRTQTLVPVGMIPSLLPERGIPPGETLDLSIHASISPLADPFSISVEIRSESGDALAVKDHRGDEGTLRLWEGDDWSATSGSLVFRGEGLRRAWMLHPWTTAEMEDDGSWSLLFIDHYSWMVSPLLRNHDRDLSVSLDFTPFLSPGEEQGRVSVFFSTAGEHHFRPDSQRSGITSGSERRSLAVVLPAANGEGVRRLRIDPSENPGLVLVHAVTVEGR
jgi:arylsulfatase A-like enzyme